MFSVYIVVNRMTLKGYVGITGMGVQKRWQHHQKDANRGSNWALHASMRKYGIDAFEVHVLAEGLCRTEAIELEKQMIVKHVTRAPSGYNMTDGGDGAVGYKHTEEWKAELSRRYKGRKMPPEAVERQRQAMLGWQPTDETRANMAAAQTGRKHSSKTIQKMQESAVRRWQNKPYVLTPKEHERLRTLRTGAKNTPEHKAIISATMKGKPKSLEHRAKLSAARKAAWDRKNGEDRV
jgi:group I intron endonuclease